MSAGQLQDLVPLVVAVATGGKSEKHSKLATNIWRRFRSGVIPYSRGHESEADKIADTDGDCRL
jgi:predicted Zn-dependent protease